VGQGGRDGNPSPNLGQLFSIGSLTGTTAPAGFDVAPGGTAFVARVASGPLGQASQLVTLDLGSGTSTVLGLIGNGRVPVRDIAVVPSVQLGARLSAVSEVDGNAVITVTRTEGSLGPVSVDFATSSGSATAGSDFRSTTGTLMFGPGETTTTIRVPILNDRRAEGDEFFSVVLSNPTGGVVLGGPSVATVRINANDRLDFQAPSVRNVGLLGPAQAVSGILLRFSEDIDPTRAQDLANYAVFGLGGGGQRVRIGLNSATYDPVRRSVALTVSEPFMLTRFRNLEIRASSRGSGGLRDISGNRLDGDGNRIPGGDAVLVLQVASGPSLTIVDHDGDRATIRLQNGGTLNAVGLIRGPRNSFPQAWLVSPVPGQSTLTGSVRRGVRGDGIVNLEELAGIGQTFFRPDLLPGIRVKTLTFRDEARVIA
jgi:hypothetical protein